MPESLNAIASMCSQMSPSSCSANNVLCTGLFCSLKTLIDLFQDFFCESAPDGQDGQLTQNQLQTIRLSLRPHGQPQERVFPLLAYLVYYGQAVLDKIIEQTDVFDFRHRIMYL